MKKNSKQRLFEMMGKVDTSFKKKLNEDMYTDDQITQSHDNWHVNEPDMDDIPPHEISNEEFIKFLEDTIKKYEDRINDYKQNRPNDSNINFEIDNLDMYKKTLDTVKKQAGLRESNMNEYDAKTHEFHNMVRGTDTPTIKDISRDERVVINDVTNRFGMKIAKEFERVLGERLNAIRNDYTQEEWGKLIGLAATELGNVVSREIFEGWQ
ncbi:MAG: hypothetical protein ACOC2W_02185 [bacterium]